MRDMVDGDIYAGVRLRDWFGITWCAPWCLNDSKEGWRAFHAYDPRSQSDAVPEPPEDPHKRVWTGPGELERTGYIDPPASQPDAEVNHETPTQPG